MKKKKNIVRLQNLSPGAKIWLALREFLAAEGIDKASVLAFYSIFSTFFLLMFFIYFSARHLGGTKINLDSIFPFSPEFFDQVSPDFFERAALLSDKLQELGYLGISVFLALAVLIFKKIIQFVNAMFQIRIQKTFILKRFQEFALLALVGLLLVTSVLMTAFINTISVLGQKQHILPLKINPLLIETVNTFLIKYLVPFLVTFLLFYILFKWIPERRVSLRAALYSALLTALLWEVVKRLYAYYIINFSLFAQFKGPVIAIILFGFWMEFSMSILLFGAKLTYIFDGAEHGYLKRNC